MQDELSKKLVQFLAVKRDETQKPFFMSKWANNFENLAVICIYWNWSYS